jgi:hypothetical protein
VRTAVDKFSEVGFVAFRRSIRFSWMLSVGSPGG